MSVSDVIRLDVNVLAPRHCEIAYRKLPQRITFEPIDYDTCIKAEPIAFDTVYHK
jgi:hypothetical protein